MTFHHTDAAAPSGRSPTAAHRTLRKSGFAASAEPFSRDCFRLAPDPAVERELAFGAAVHDLVADADLTELAWERIREADPAHLDPDSQAVDTLSRAIDHVAADVERLVGFFVAPPARPTGTPRSEAETDFHLDFDHVLTGLSADVTLMRQAWAHLADNAPVPFDPNSAGAAALSRATDHVTHGAARLVELYAARPAGETAQLGEVRA